MPIDAGQRMPDHDPVELGRAVGATLKAAGMTQTAVAAATGIDQGRLSNMIRYAKGIRPGLDELRRIETACGFGTGYILGLAGLISIEGATAGLAAAEAELATVTPIRTAPPARPAARRAARKRPPK